jgi:hypothetical protein
MGTNYYARIPVERPVVDLEFRDKVLAAAAEADAAVFRLDRTMRERDLTIEQGDSFADLAEIGLERAGYLPPFDVLHIGKSSAGWTFALHVIPERGLNDLENWELLLSETAGALIVDEYGKALTLDELLNVIRERGRAGTAPRSAPNGYTDWPAFHAANHSVDGPGGLVRSRVDGKRCIKHGEGTWDCYVGEFS